MITYLFIWTIVAGTCQHTGAGGYCTPIWKQSWTNAGIFDSSEACRRAAANLGLAHPGFRCIQKVSGEAR